MSIIVAPDKRGIAAYKRAQEIKAATEDAAVPGNLAENVSSEEMTNQLDDSADEVSVASDNVVEDDSADEVSVASDNVVEDDTTSEVVGSVDGNFAEEPGDSE